MKKFIDVEICGNLIKNRSFDNFEYCRQQGYWSVIIYSFFIILFVYWRYFRYFQFVRENTSV